MKSLSLKKKELEMREIEQESKEKKVCLPRVADRL